jgi:hypothetical protein
LQGVIVPVHGPSCQLQPAVAQTACVEYVLHADGVVPVHVPPTPPSPPVQVQPSATHWLWKLVVALVQSTHGSGVPLHVAAPAVQPWQLVPPHDDDGHCAHVE